MTLLHGEASFEVFGEARSFNVYASPRRFTTDIDGTRFIVRRIDRDKLEVIVIKGEVTALAGSQRTPLTPALIRARPSFGEHIFKSSEIGALGAGWQLTRTLTPTEIDEHVAWQSSRTAFSRDRSKG
ncbi:MAG TPA: hypothetical protein VNA21_12105 [Steroidobacteraceae bacterium]|nr:hypothetical protein [Steroidobacteraceae bacterium]